MIRSLLADRFGMTVHRETRERPVYMLVVARKDGRTGPGLKRVDVNCAALYAPHDRKDSPEARDPEGCGTTIGPGVFIARAQTMAQMVAALATLSNTGMPFYRPIVDGTGLSGVFGKEELSDAKSYSNGIFLLSLEPQRGLADRLAQIKVMNLPKNYLETYTTKINSVEPDQIESMAKKYMATDNDTIVVVGDASKIEKALEKIGTFQVVQPEGAKPTQ
jgi:hypothetical protein